MYRCTTIQQINTNMKMNGRHFNVSLEISDEELIIFEEISRLSVGEYQNVFGHTLPSSISFLPLSSQEVLDIMKKVIEAKDESLWDQIFPPLPDDCYS